MRLRFLAHPSSSPQQCVPRRSRVTDPGVAALICPITGAGTMANRLAKDLVVKAEEHGKPVFVVWGSPVGTEVAYTDILLPSALPVFRPGMMASRHLSGCSRACRGGHHERSGGRVRDRMARGAAPLR